MTFYQKGTVASLGLITVAIWGIAVFLLFSEEKQIPSNNHETRQVQYENKQVFMYKKDETVTVEKNVNLTKVKSNAKDNRISIDVLLAGINN